jgi:hypothetical protein
MIITDDFVYLVYPKTASAFTREVLDKIHCTDNKFAKWFYSKFKNFYYPSYYERKKVVKIEVHNRKGALTEHGLYLQIPSEHQSKKVFTVTRDPFDRLVSLYTYRDWEETNELLINDFVKTNYPNYPNLTFEEFVTCLYTVNPLVNDAKFDLKEDIGPLTIQFILFYFKDPYTVLNQKLSYNYIYNNLFIEDMPNIFFAKMSNLKEDLILFLTEMGYHPKQLEFIQSKGKTNISRKEGLGYQDFYSKELLEYVTQKERYLIHFCKVLNLELN